MLAHSLGGNSTTKWSVNSGCKSSNTRYWNQCWFKAGLPSTTLAQYLILGYCVLVTSLNYFMRGFLTKMRMLIQKIRSIKISKYSKGSELWKDKDKPNRISKVYFYWSRPILFWVASVPATIITLSVGICLQFSTFCFWKICFVNCIHM